MAISFQIWNVGWIRTKEPYI